MANYDSICALGAGALVSSASVNADSGAQGTTETTIYSEALPVGRINLVGQNVWLRLWGVFTSSAVPPTLTIRIKYGSTTLATLIPALTALLTNQGWKASADLTTRASGSVFAQGDALFRSAAAVLDNAFAANTAAGAPTTTGTVTLNVTAQWGTATAGNVLTLTNALPVLDGIVPVP
jgi:hypothetical protein